MLAYHPVQLLRARLARRADGELITCRQDAHPETEAVALARAASVVSGLHRVWIRLPTPTASGDANPHVR